MALEISCSPLFGNWETGKYTTDWKHFYYTDHINMIPWNVYVEWKNKQSVWKKLFGDMRPSVAKIKREMNLK